MGAVIVQPITIAVIVILILGIIGFSIMAYMLFRLEKKDAAEREVPDTTGHADQDIDLEQGSDDAGTSHRQSSHSEAPAVVVERVSAGESGSTRGSTEAGERTRTGDQKCSEAMWEREDAGREGGRVPEFLTPESEEAEWRELKKKLQEEEGITVVCEPGPPPPQQPARQ